MNKLLVVLIVGLFLGLSLVSSYNICIDLENDNPQVQHFKETINRLSFEQDLKNNMTIEGIRLKLKYFSPCK